MEKERKTITLSVGKKVFVQSVRFTITNISKTEPKEANFFVKFKNLYLILEPSKAEKQSNGYEVEL